MDEGFEEAKTRADQASPPFPEQSPPSGGLNEAHESNIAHPFESSTDAEIDEDMSPPLRLSRCGSMSTRRGGQNESFASDKLGEEGKEKDETDQSTSQFSNAVQYWLQCIGNTVGFGNVWRFPYLVFSCGGGAFLIPYLISAAIFGVPLFMLETAIGQVIRKSLPKIFSTINERVSFLPFGMLLGTLSVSIYYVVLISWSMLYFVYSFMAPLPWSHVEPESGVFWDQKFFPDTILQKSSSISHLGSLNWRMLLSSLASWLLIFLCMFKGVQSTGKVAYITTLLPYCLLLVFLIKACTLDGISVGLKFFFIPKWSALLNIYVWVRAASQVLFSATLGVGTLIMYSSYRAKGEKIVKPSIVIPLINSATSILAGVILFSLLGHMAHEKGIDIESLPLEGPDLVFVVYPAILTQLPGSNLWAIAFFAMLVMIGTSSAFGMVETFLHLMRDRCKVMNCKISNELLTAIVCLACFLFSILFVTGAGLYMVELFDFYANTIPLTLGAFLQTIFVCWVYKIENLQEKLTEQTGEFFPLYVRICVKYIAPIFLLIILIFSFISAFQNSLRFPPWAFSLGIMLFLIPVFIMLLGLFIPEFHRLAERHPKLRRFYMRMTCTRPENLSKKLEKQNGQQKLSSKPGVSERGCGSAENMFESQSDPNILK